MFNNYIKTVVCWTLLNKHLYLLNSVVFQTFQYIKVILKTISIWGGLKDPNNKSQSERKL